MWVRVASILCIIAMSFCLHLSCSRSLQTSEQILDTGSESLNQILLDMRVILALRLERSDEDVVFYFNKVVADTNQRTGAAVYEDFALAASVFQTLLSRAQLLSSEGTSGIELLKSIADVFVKTSFNRFETLLTNTESRLSFAEAIAKSTIAGVSAVSPELKVIDGLPQMIPFVAGSLVTDDSFFLDGRIALASSFVRGSALGLIELNGGVEKSAALGSDFIGSIFAPYSGVFVDDAESLKQVNGKIVSALVSEFAKTYQSDSDLELILKGLLGAGLKNIELIAPTTVADVLSDLGLVVASDWVRGVGGTLSNSELDSRVFRLLAEKIVEVGLQQDAGSNELTSLSQKLVAGMKGVPANPIFSYYFDDALRSLIEQSVEGGRATAVTKFEQQDSEGPDESEPPVDGGGL